MVRGVCESIAIAGAGVGPDARARWAGARARCARFPRCGQLAEALIR